jgi:hypothetical protein
MWKNQEEPDSPEMAINTTHAHFMLVTYGYRQSLRIGNNYCFIPTLRLVEI